MTESMVNVQLKLIAYIGCFVCILSLLIDVCFVYFLASPIPVLEQTRMSLEVYWLKDWSRRMYSMGRSHESCLLITTVNYHTLGYSPTLRICYACVRDCFAQIQTKGRAQTCEYRAICSWSA